MAVASTPYPGDVPAGRTLHPAGHGTSQAIRALRSGHGPDGHSRQIS